MLTIIISDNNQSDSTPDHLSVLNISGITCTFINSDHKKKPLCSLIHIIIYKWNEDLPVLVACTRRDCQSVSAVLKILPEIIIYRWNMEL